ncbi:methyltransferase domain-containing protein [Streptomyces sp. NBC_00249]|uniref:methyltransferase domain-containing protein n=1 Tax=Streptomyces sp. NBC_00249 TaxID=2975690 RepID=UPI00225BAA2F|nr:methyltransferase domain-containing protein [Streptomyces sp. NBC_00249]MCX5199528.1 methyltransferase domain-containing protein [Streptomyces sp. NBC_00249]
MSESDWTPAEVAELYDSSCRMATMFNDGYEHLGYWYDDKDDASVEEAGKRLTRKVVDILGLRRGEHLLDAGCGVGAPATQIAREVGARVTGITISPAECEAAEKRAAKAGLFHRVRFQVRDYHELPYDEGHFDAVMAMEALSHSVDLAKALSEFYRVLKPGGRLAITETTMVHPDAQLPPFFRSRRPMTADGWLEVVRGLGFVVEEWTQCGHRVYGMGNRYVARTEALREELVAEFGAEFVDAVKQGQKDMFAPGPEHMGYVILCARKPAS